MNFCSFGLSVWSVTHISFGCLVVCKHLCVSQLLTSRPITRSLCTCRKFRLKNLTPKKSGQFPWLDSFCRYSRKCHKERNHLLWTAVYSMMSRFFDCCQQPSSCSHTHTEPPPAVTVQGNVTASPGSRAVLTCHVVSTVSFNLTWLRGGQDARLDPRVNVLANLSLQVSAVTPDHSGWYECQAVNEGGVTAERLYLTVQGEERVFMSLCVLRF